MGSFSAWHLLISGLQVLILLTVIIGITYFFFQKSRKAASEGSPNLTSPTTTTKKSPTQQIIAITYFVGGLFGAVVLLSQLQNAAPGPISALLWLFLIIQVAAALYGSWQFWNLRPIGSQLLYWLSWSTVPVISFPLLSYWCAIGFAIFPTIDIGPSIFGTNLNFRFGYDSQLWLNPGMNSFTIGLNLVSPAFVYAIAKIMHEAGIPKWPLVLPNTAQSF